MKNTISKARLATCCLLLFCGVRVGNAVTKSVTQEVDPFIGTAYVGHTYPCATTPFGMVQVGPDNRFGHGDWTFCSGYNDASTYIEGFSHTHLSGTGCPDMGDIMLMPVTGNVSFEEKDGKAYGSEFSHTTEKASPGYYAVTLSDYGIRAEMTATPRAGFHKYTYPANAQSGIMIDMGHGVSDNVKESFIKVLDNQTIVGYRRSTGFVGDHQYYFCARFSKPFEQVVSFQDGTKGDARSVTGKNTKMLVQFATTEAEAVKVKVGLSTTGTAGAMKNLDSEIKGWNFDAVRNATDKLWNSYLSRISVNTLEEGQRVAFYTSLYHALIMPNLITDVDGAYVGWDHAAHKSSVGPLYTNFSLWDTYRALHPFLALMYPKENSRMVKSMLEHYKQTGMLPTNEYGLCETWCMIGNHAGNVIAEALLKGDKSVNAEEAYEAVKHSQTVSHEKSNWELYNRCGYFPCDDQDVESVSRTLEACYDDYCVAMLAKALHKTADYDFFLKRSNNYRNLFDPSTGFMRPRDSKGNWKTPFNPYMIEDAKGHRDFTEGNSWQWTWHVQQDAAGLIALMGSKEKFVNKLDSLFFIDPKDLPGLDNCHDVTGLVGVYAHGNEPSHHVAYLYNFAGRADKTAIIVRTIFDKYYQPKRDGLCGNDDCGQMSAWYMFSAMGFYPVCPISGEYIFGAPQFKNILLKLPNGKSLNIRANGISKENKYVKTIRLNGHVVDGHAISYMDLMKGGTLEYDMVNHGIAE